MKMFRGLLAASLCLLTLSTTHAATPGANAYLSARSNVKISRLTLAEARSSSGHQGQIVEWAGTVQGTGRSEEGACTFLRMPDGQTVQIKGDGLTIGTPIYVIARVREKSGLLHHLEPIAMAPCNEVRSAFDEVQKAAAAASARRTASRPTSVSASGPMMQMDPRVLAARAGSLSLAGATSWIKSFNRGLDDASAQALARSILYYCGNYHVDSRLALSLFAAESCFRQDAVSCVGAMGIGQLMPETASSLGVRNPYDAVQNAEGSIRHISTLLDRWRGSKTQYQLVLASYNAGAGAVEQYNGIPPYPETVNYVKTILGYYGELCRYQ